MNRINALKLEVLEQQKEYWSMKVANLNKNPGFFSSATRLSSPTSSPEHSS